MLANVRLMEVAQEAKMRRMNPTRKRAEKGRTQGHPSFLAALQVLALGSSQSSAFFLPFEFHLLSLCSYNKSSFLLKLAPLSFCYIYILKALSFMGVSAST